MVVQINGKLRGKILAPDEFRRKCFSLIKKDEELFKYISGKQIIKTIIVKNKLINLWLNRMKAYHYFFVYLFMFI